jgi:2-phosphosulfolactate phosphatase
MSVSIAIGEAGCHLANELQAVAIVVDALRASATMATLLHFGAREIWVVAEVEEAWRLKETMPDALLVGERQSVKVAGFDFSNSPTEILQASELVQGRRVIFTSTTGARRLLACRQAAAILVGTTVNATAVAKVAKERAERQQRPIVLVASGVWGKGDEWATEDVAAAWVIAERMNLPIVQAPNRPEGELAKVFAESRHGKELLALSLNADVEWCAQVDVVTVVPQVVALEGAMALVKAAS